MKKYLFFAFTLGAFFALPLLYFATLAIGFLIGCVYMHMQESDSREKQCFVKNSLPASEVKHIYVENSTEKVNQSNKKLRSAHIISGSSEFNDFVTPYREVKTKEKKPEFLEGLPKTIISRDISRNQMVEYACKLFHGAFSSDTINLLSTRILQDLYLACYKHFSNLNISSSDFNLFLEQDKLAEQTKLDEENQIINKSDLEMNKSIEQCRKIYESRSERTNELINGRSSIRMTQWEEECLVRFYQQGIDLSGLSLILNRTEMSLRSKLIYKGVYKREISKSVEKAEADCDQLMEFAIIRICRILDLDHHYFLGLDSIGLEHLELLERILKYKN